MCDQCAGAAVPNGPCSPETPYSDDILPPYQQTKTHLSTKLEHSSLQIARMHVSFRRKEEHLCLAKLVRSSREASAVGSSAFTSGAIPKCASAPTTIKQSTALYGTHRRT